MKNWLIIIDCENAGKVSNKTYIDVDNPTAFTWEKELNPDGSKKELTLLINGKKFKESTTVCEIYDTNGETMDISFIGAIDLLIDGDYTLAQNKVRKPNITNLI